MPSKVVVGLQCDEFSNENPKNASSGAVVADHPVQQDIHCRDKVKMGNDLNLESLIMESILMKCRTFMLSSSDFR